MSYRSRLQKLIQPETIGVVIIWTSVAALFLVFYSAYRSKSARDLECLGHLETELDIVQNEEPTSSAARDWILSGKATSEFKRWFYEANK